jgi:Tfp pilus assembly protein PilW
MNNPDCWLRCRADLPARSIDVVPRDVTARRRRCGKGLADDAGTSLIELITAMSIMSVVGAVFTAGIVMMYRSTNAIETRSGSQSQLHIAFTRLDKEIRYATGISVPDQLPSGWYVEYSFLDTGTNPPVSKCSELWLDTAAKRLRMRTWVEGSTAGTFAVLASDVNATQPFTMPGAPANTTSDFQRLRLSLAADAGPSSTRPPNQFNVTFTALNTSASSDAATCAAERPAS